MGNACSKIKENMLVQYNIRPMSTFASASATTNALTIPSVFVTPTIATMPHGFMLTTSENQSVFMFYNSIQFVEKLTNRKYYPMTLEMIDQIKNGTFKLCTQEQCLSQNGYYESDIVVHMVHGQTVVLRFYKSDSVFNNAFNTIINANA
jgi:hypothetical protein